MDDIIIKRTAEEELVRAHEEFLSARDNYFNYTEKNAVDYQIRRQHYHDTAIAVSVCVGHMIDGGYIQ